MSTEGDRESPVTVVPQIVVPATPIAPERPATIRQVPESKPTTFTKVVLVLTGLVLIGLSAFAVFAGHEWGNETAETSMASPSTTTRLTGVSGASGAAGATTVTKKTVTEYFGSDSLLTAAFATGAALIALGLLYPRLRTLKLPGGVEAGFGPTDDEKKKIDENVDEQVKAGYVQQKDADAVKRRAETIAAAQKLERMQTSSGWGSPAVTGWGSVRGGLSSSDWGSSGGSSNWGSSTASGWGGPELSDDELAQSVKAAAAVTSSGDD